MKRTLRIKLMYIHFTTFFNVCPITKSICKYVHPLSIEPHCDPVLLYYVTLHLLPAHLDYTCTQFYQERRLASAYNTSEIMAVVFGDSQLEGMQKHIDDVNSGEVPVYLRKYNGKGMF